MNNLYIFGITSAKGGIETMMKHVINNADLKQKNVFIVTSYQNIAFEELYIKSGVRILKIPQRLETKLYRKELIKIFSSLTKDDVAYINIASYCNWELFRSLKRAKCKIIVHGHNSHVSNVFKKVLHFFGKKFFKDIGYKIAVSEDCNRFMFDNCCDEVINNGIESELFDFNLNNRQDIRKRLAISDDKIVIGCLGRISKEKNQIFLAKESPKYTNYLFVFIGGFMNIKYEKKIKDAASSNCLFVGEKEDAWKYLSSLDAMMLPSKHEGFPLAVAEALTNDMPVFYLKKLYKNLAPSIKNNGNSFIYDTNGFDNEFLISVNKKRNIGEAKNIRLYDVSLFLSKIEKVIYE